MPESHAEPAAVPSRDLRPWLAVAGTVALTALCLRLMGRIWWCACGEIDPFSSDVNSAHNSQHLFDPYSFTHLLHGILFCWLFTWLWPRLPPAWAMWPAVVLEAGWEVLENTPMVINRFRNATLAVGYEGDSVVNSLGDILSCGLGFVLARAIGFRASLAVLLVVEVALVLAIRDNLFLSTLMLVAPLDFIKEWQTAG